MITLSNRLLSVASLVPRCAVLADVGTDHGYLPVWLIQNGIAERVLASDIGEGPLLRAGMTVEKFGLEEQIRLVLADGLQYSGSDLAEVVTICGMGGETMISILEAAPWTEGRQLILQPQSKLPELEQWLKVHRFGIRQAALSEDAGKLYLAFSAQPNTAWTGSAEKALFQMRDPLLRKYLSQEARKASKALTGLRQSREVPTDQIRMLEERLKIIDHRLEEMKSW